jgi:hypothetical protein
LLGLVLVDLYLGISGKSILVVVEYILLTLVVLCLDLLLCGIGRKSVQSKPMELKKINFLDN